MMVSAGQRKQKNLASKNETQNAEGKSFFLALKREPQISHDAAQSDPLQSILGPVQAVIWVVLQSIISYAFSNVAYPFILESQSDRC